jgi:LysM repeat protein
MTTPLDAVEPPLAPDPPSDPTTPPEPVPSLSIADICPYLVASHGGWRSATPNRDHRCTAVDPPAPLPNDKQRSLCLTAAHVGCPAFRAARAARASMLAPGVDPAIVASADASRRPIARATPVVLEPARLSIGGGVGTDNRTLYQAGLVGLMVLAFVVVLVARLSTSDSAGASPSAVPSVVPSPSPTATPRPTPTPTPVPSGSGVTPSGSGGVPQSAAPSQATTSQEPAFRTTYSVKSGDTLVGIASTFGTTVAELQRLNNLSDADLKIGQLLKIP